MDFVYSNIVEPELYGVQDTRSCEEWGLIIQVLTWK